MNTSAFVDLKRICCGIFVDVALVFLVYEMLMYLGDVLGFS